MHLEPRIGLLVLGVVLVLFAILGGWVLRGAPAALRSTLRVVVGILGVALVAWFLAPYAGGQWAGLRTPPPAAAPPHPARPADLVRLASSELSACALPSAPGLPDSVTATRAQMAAARQGFEAYDAATNAYVKCVDSAIDRVAAQHAGSASQDDLARLKVFGGTAHNTAIDEEQAVANQFNAQIRAYKAKHPK